MPVVAGRSTSLLLRNARLGLARGAAVVLTLLLAAIGLAQLWLAASNGAPARDNWLAWSLVNHLSPNLQANAAEAEGAAALQAAAETGPQQVSRALDDITGVLALHPVQPRLWLMRAKLLQKSGAPGRAASDALKMVYFTSPVAGAMTFARLQAALQLQRIDDPELSEFIRGDISALVLQRNDQQSRIVDAYQTASQAGRAFAVRVVSDLKPELLSALK